MIETAVRVSQNAKCAFCVEGDVDTQLRPCLHLFHGRCLKPWLQVAKGPPLCLTCETPISSCVLAIPTACGRTFPTTCLAVGGPNSQPSTSHIPGIMKSESREDLQDAPTIDGDEAQPEPVQGVIKQAGVSTEKSSGAGDAKGGQPSSDNVKISNTLSSDPTVGTDDGETEAETESV
eukprot:FR738991.1.p1 GENE.FR738991.1~~FR738991.1.p1  ORF type:complete len:199 (+),score=16.25 FR738991.1:67-597(+)